ncbi:MAG: hypothetical protein LBL84_01150 [Candidatus Nomurabacteria bacterium]|jgi:hypothetical protein|nr:hypothetical protein [Candidatus Nomurabacteria bacterium]
MTDGNNPYMVSTLMGAYGVQYEGIVLCGNVAAVRMKNEGDNLAGQIRSFKPAGFHSVYAGHGGAMVVFHTVNQAQDFKELFAT